MTPQSDIDSGFVGVDMRVDASHLAPGYAAYAENCRFTEGVASQRRGIVCMPWGPTTHGEGGSIESIDPFIDPAAIGIFRDPNNDEVALVAANDRVWRVYPNNTAKELTMPAGEKTGSEVKFIQAFDTVVMLRGENKPMLRLDSLNYEWKEIETESRGDGTVAMPNASEGIFINNRLAVIHGRDEVAVSDFLDYTRYDPVKSLFRVNQGSEDRLVGIANVDNNTIALFKTNSIYLLRNFYGDLSDARLDELTRDYGCIAPKTITRVGADLVFLSRRGICSIRITEQGHIQGVDEPMSKPIQPIIDSIDWKYANVARAAFHDNKIYFALPLSYRKQFGKLLSNTVIATASDEFTLSAQSGGETVSISFKEAVNIDGINNAIAVYDLVNRAWAGIDVGDEISVKDFAKVQFSRSQRLFFLGNSGFIFMHDDPVFCGSHDDIRELDGNDYKSQTTPKAVRFKLRTRGYLGSSPSKKRFHKVEVNYSQRNAKLNINVIGDGPHNNDKVVTDKTFDRTKYMRPFDAAPYVVTNINDDHQTEGREDYTIKAGDNFRIGQSGISPDSMQYFAARKPLRSRGTRLQVEVVNSEGTIKVHSSGVNATIDDEKTTGSL